MLDKTTASQSVGLTLSGEELLGAHLELKGAEPVIRSFFTVPITQNEVFTSNEDASEHVKQLYKYKNEPFPPVSDQWLLISGLKAKQTLTRTIEIQLTKPSDVEAVIEFQAEPHLPYSLDEATLDHIQVSRTEESTLVTIVSTKNEQLQEHLDQMRSLDLEPEIISCAPAALASFSDFFGPDSDAPIFVLHIDLEETIRVLASGGKLLASHRLSIGVKHLQNALSDDMECDEQEALSALKKVDFLTLSNEKTPQLYDAFENLKREISKTLYALAKQNKAQYVEEILVTGIGGSLSNINEALSSDLPTEVTPPKNSGEQSTQELQKFAIPIGLALSALPNTPSQIDFRQNEFAYPNPWKRYKQPLAIYYLLCVLTSISLYYLGQSWIDYKSTDVQIRYSKLLTALEKPYLDFENKYLGNDSTEDSIEPLHLAELSASEISQRVSYLQGKIRKAPRSFPLFANVPRVSDLLAWLATHPQVIGSSADTSPLKIESISYTMTKRPTKSKIRDRYQVKVELEFTTPIPKSAREFRDALMAPNEMVDPKAEVQWTSTRDVYKTTFFLKDRTNYP